MLKNNNPKNNKVKFERKGKNVLKNA